MTVEEVRPPTTSNQHQSSQSVAPVGVGESTSFLKFSQANPPLAKEFLSTVSEVTGVTDVDLLSAAFNATSAQGQNENSVATAIEWILERPQKTHLPAHLNNERTASIRRPAPLQTTFPVVNNTAEMPPAVAMNRADLPQPAQPPNSPNQPQKPLVDLTEGGNGSGSGPESGPVQGSEDAELQRAIKLSLQDQGRSRESFGGSAFSQEDQDVSRALEASLMESQNGAKRKRGENWVDPLNPHDRERSGLWPVGLKNVGQTCWFSAVMQSLYHIPAFRNLVLNYHPMEQVMMNLNDPTNNGTPGNGQGDVTIKPTFDDKQKKIIEFMQELRKLFALMVASQRKYVDPSRAVDILRGSIGCSSSNGENNQQDVSEFTHIVLEWVELAFKKVLPKKEERMEEEEENAENVDPNLGCENNRSLVTNSASNNAMSKLFYGSLLIEGNVDGKAFSKKEVFGQYPLQVNSFKDIHDSLENTTAHEYFDSSGESGSGQERWFTELPPVLFFSLSRFQFNQERRLAEKIHNRLDFPEMLYMDRYMVANKNVTRDKREQVKRLKEQRVELASKLERFTRFGSGNEKISLSNVLQYTMDFASAGHGTAQTGTDGTVSLAPDISMASPPEGHQHHQPQQQHQHQQQPHPMPSSNMTSLMQVDSPCPSPKMTPAHSLSNLVASGSNNGHETAKDESMPMDVEMSCKEDEEASALSSHSSQYESTRGCDNDPNKTAASPSVMTSNVAPCPNHISEVELRVLQNCLSRWKAEVKSDVSNLESAIREIDLAIEGMYDEDCLKKLQYRLHAVMVHEGGIESGHYWAYVFDHKKKSWLKFNDNTVTEATWEELLKESVGGHSNTSAYSLVYIDTSKPDTLAESDRVMEGDSSMEKMESGAIESLINILPNDLASFVTEDNLLFEKERRKWDIDQENRKKQEAILRECAAGTNTDPNSDVEVLQEKLTYVHTHAKLSMRTSCDIIKAYIASLREGSFSLHAALETISEKTLHHYQRLLQPSDSPEFSEGRLESFILYLLKNGTSKELQEMAVLEQFSLPGLDNDGQHASAIRSASDEKLITLRKTRSVAALELREWHQAYHLFRVSAHCYVMGVDNFLIQKFECSLDLFIIAYNVSVKIMESPPKASFKGLRTTPLVQALCQSLLEVNSTLIKQFKLGERLNDILTSIQKLVIPALIILENRIARQESTMSSNVPGQKPSFMNQTCARLREDWCALLAEPNLPPESSAFTSQILEAVLDPTVKGGLDLVMEQIPRSCDHIEQSADLKLSVRYRDAVKRMRDFQSSLVSTPSTTATANATNPSMSGASPSSGMRSSPSSDSNKQVSAS